MAALATALGAKTLGGTLANTHVPDAAAATELVRHEVRAGDSVLVKGSNSIGLAALVDALTGGRSQ
jgi:UDP-N-acetylmuramoyl-tripeptide--D-alanyl-D-alanine ligase